MRTFLRFINRIAGPMRLALLAVFLVQLMGKSSIGISVVQPVYDWIAVFMTANILAVSVILLIWILLDGISAGHEKYLYTPDKRPEGKRSEISNMMGIGYMFIGLSFGAYAGEESLINLGMLLGGFVFILPMYYFLRKPLASLKAAYGDERVESLREEVALQSQEGLFEKADLSGKTYDELLVIRSNLNVIEESAQSAEESKKAIRDLVS